MTEELGRTVAVHPDTQMVWPVSAWLTDGLTAPGGRAEFGRTAPAELPVMPPAALTGIGAEDLVTLVGRTFLAVFTTVELGPAAAGTVCEPPHPATEQTEQDHGRRMFDAQPRPPHHEGTVACRFVWQPGNRLVGAGCHSRTKAHHRSPGDAHPRAIACRPPLGSSYWPLTQAGVQRLITGTGDDVARSHCHHGPWPEH